MRKSALTVFCFALALSACTTVHHSSKEANVSISYLTSFHKAKPGNDIAFYPEAAAIHRPYRIIGKETVSRYNLIGLERPPKNLDLLMKNLAASMGGDAIIDKRMDQKKVEGTVISFEKVLL